MNHPAISAIVTAPVAAYQFEAVGFLEHRKDAERLNSDTTHVLAQSLFAALAGNFAAHGFTALEKVYITEDDAQGDTEVKFFVCVRLQGNSPIVENELPPRELGQLMAGLCAPVCCAVDGTWLLTPEDWELAAIDEPDVSAN